LCRLKTAITTYGTYKDIPKEEKSKLISHYRHDEIKAPLFQSSSQKCAFCECKPAEGGNIEVEHFIPKSKYPDFTFDWNNFLPSCRKCNGSKDDHDTIKNPIVNPYNINPDDVFHYNDIKISAKSNSYKDIGDNTIDVCSLNSVRLMRPRAEILVSLHYFSDSIDEAVLDYQNANTDQKRRNRKRKIGEALESIEILANPNERYSGFCKHYLENSNSYISAKKIVNINNA